MVKIPKSTNCGVIILTGYDVRFVLQRVQRSWMEPSESLSPIILLKMDIESVLLETFPSIAASKFWGFYDQYW